MPATLTIRDECSDGTHQQFDLEVPTERLTVRELIRSRVYQDVQDLNLRRPKIHAKLIEPEADERALNKPKPQGNGNIDWRRHYERALAAFAAKQLLVLVGDRQLDALDDMFDISPATCVTFFRLTLLTGG